MSDPMLFIQDLAVILLAAAVCGWISSKLQLSPIVGYLIAGVIVGTPQITFPYVTDEDRIAVISQLGVVFLMFSIGLQFRLRRIRELGLSVVFAAALTAIFVLSFGRLAATIAGMGQLEAFALAAVFVTSSSAIIAKTVQDSGLSHARHGQLALGVTLLEDIVAVAVMAVLGTLLLTTEAARTPSSGYLVTLMLGFAATVLITGWLIIPRLLKWLGRSGQTDISHIFLAGVLLMLAWLAVQAGYSLAMGAFLFGMIVAESRQRAEVERSFLGLRDVFLTVFFVTIGMRIEISQFAHAWLYILLGTAFAIAVRGGSAFLAFMLCGERPAASLRAAALLTPIGEFSFIIIGLAVAANVLPEVLSAATVGIALTTCITAPLLSKLAVHWVGSGETDAKPIALDRYHNVYRQLLGKIRTLFPGGILWRLLRKRLIQISIEILLVATVLAFADPIFWQLKDRIAWPDLMAPGLVQSIYWLVLCMALLIPVLAIWRNAAAVGLILADYSNRTGGLRNKALLQIIAFSPQWLCALLLVFILWHLLPSGEMRLWLAGSLLAAGLLALALGWRMMVRWHSHLEVALESGFTKDDRARELQKQAIESSSGWNLSVEELTLTDDAYACGKTLAELALRQQTGCSLVGIERAGFALHSITSATQLFAGDVLLLLGAKHEIQQARNLLRTVSNDDTISHGFVDHMTETHRVAAHSRACGRTLAELDWSNRYQVQVLARRKDSRQELIPAANSIIEAGDLLLLFGRKAALQRLQFDLENDSATAGSPDTSA